MLVVTTPAVERRRVTRCLGVVSGEAILGAHAESSRAPVAGCLLSAGDTPVVSE